MYSLSGNRELRRAKMSLGPWLRTFLGEEALLGWPTSPTNWSSKSCRGLGLGNTCWDSSASSPADPWAPSSFLGGGLSTVIETRFSPQNSTRQGLTSLSACFEFFGLIFLNSSQSQDQIHMLVESLESANEDRTILQDAPHPVVDVLQHLAALGGSSDVYIRLTYLWGIFFFFLKDLFIYLFSEREGGKKERERETLKCSCLSCTPNWGPFPKPRHLPDWELNRQPLWFTGLHSIHWATPARAEESSNSKFFKKILLFIFRERGREGERERNINMWLPLMRPPLGTWPPT